MQLKCHYVIDTEEVLGYGYCNYEVGDGLNEKIITEIPMDNQGNNLLKKDLKFDKRTGTLKIKNGN